MNWQLYSTSFSQQSGVKDTLSFPLCFPPYLISQAKNIALFRSIILIALGKRSRMGQKKSDNYPAFYMDEKLRSQMILVQIEEELSAMFSLLWKILSGTMGLIAIFVIATKYPVYLHTLHENQLWFSNIKVCWVVTPQSSFFYCLFMPFKCVCG